MSVTKQRKRKNKKASHLNKSFPDFLFLVSSSRAGTGYKTEYGKSVESVPALSTPKMELMRLRQTQKRVPALYEIVNKS